MGEVTPRLLTSAASVGVGGYRHLTGGGHCIP
jgi:hypothetical protein